MPADLKQKRKRKLEEDAEETVTLDADVVDDIPEDDEAEEERVEAEGSKPRKVKKAKSKKTPTPGIVFISHVPRGMTPQKVRHLMGRWGDIGRVYAQARDAPTGYNPNHQKDQKKRSKGTANYSEAWVEFMDKAIAKTVASMLNAQVIGGKKGDRWRDDVWTMKYLSGFKWEMLGEQVAYERQVHQSRLRAEIQRSKTEQNEYLKNVELARVLKKREDRKAAAGPASSEEQGQKSAEGAQVSKAKRDYKQREVADRAHGLAAKGMEDVLGSLF